MRARGGRGVIRKRSRAAILGIALFAALVFAAQAQAAVFTVNTTADNTPVATECQGAPSDCSLRQAIDNANAANSASTIVVPPGFYVLSNGVLAISKNLSIVGAGARSTVIDQFSNPRTRAFDIQIPPSAGPPIRPTVTISGLEIEGGKADSSNNFYGGDIRNQGNLTLSEDWITGGTTTSGSGGGVSNYGGTLTVTHSLVSFNSSTSTPTGGGGDSGGIQNFGPNPTTGEAAILKVDNSTIANNTSALGGGITNGGDASNTVSITNSTIAYNDGGTRADLPNAGGVLTFAGTTTVGTSIVAFNTVATPTAATPSNCRASSPGTISSVGNNLETGTDCGLTAAGDIQGTDPLFMQGPNNQPPFVQNNGGNTDTLALQATSPAIDAVLATATGCGGTDQRDIVRPQGNGCDIGAYELLQPVEGQQFTQVVSGANGSINGTPTINWGDNTSSAGTPDSTSGRDVTGTHTYAEEGIYHGSLVWSNSDGSPTTVPFDVRVTDATLTVNPSSVGANAGEAFSGLVATFTDADPKGTASDYSATINWGDGTTSPGTVSGSGQFAVNGTHTYAAGGFHAVTVSIADAGGATAAATGTATVAPQTVPTLTPGTPAVISTTSAAFTVTVNPGGLPTVVHVQYGPALAAASDVGLGNALAPRAVTYTSTTPSQSVGSDFSNHVVTATVTGLLPNTTYHVRAVASNAAGTTLGADQALKLPKDPPPPPPVLGQSFDVQTVSGLVLVKLPHGQPLYASDIGAHASSTLTKGIGFVPLTEARRLPSGTQIDARLGKIKLISATTKRRKTQTGTFSNGLFGLSQDRLGANKGLTTLSLLEGLFAGAPTYSSCKAKKAADTTSPTAYAAVGSNVLQTLHASAHGRFRTHGRYAAATVRGTGWTTTDRCDGTLVSVQLHAVEVTDFARHITVLVHQGHSYLAKAARGGK
jgi:hypothetical protein